MDYRDLVAWQKGMNLAERIYRQTSAFPSEERYGLKSQMRRAAVAIPSNVAEGQGRRSTDADFIRFLQMALGSLCELETQIEVSARLGLLSQSQVDELNHDTVEVGRILNGLIKSRQLRSI